MGAQATGFEFTSYSFEPEKKRAVFKYKTEFVADREPIIWTETIILPTIPRCPTPEKLLESLHIVLGMSYWKFYCAANLKLPYELSKQEADFWNIVYKKGLGEFFYKNNLDPKISPKFPYSKVAKPSPSSFKLQASGFRSLVGIGGGKDSIVSAELLKQHGISFTSFNIETHSTSSGQAGKASKIVDNVIEAIGIGSLKIQRFLDWQAHQAHQYNGHIPISAIYAFLGIFACVLYKYDYVIVSNEHSSNFGNINYKGLEVNHQWSKSFEFETLFSLYVKNIISPDVKYFSMLRSFHEIRIVEMFVGTNPSTRLRARKYFPLFSSCNKNFTAKGNEEGKLWCGQCAKCVFVFTLLSAFLSKKELIDMFGKNLYQDESLLPLFKDVLGFGTIHPHTKLESSLLIGTEVGGTRYGVGVKPFDCVGTSQEAQTALFLAKKKFKGDFIVRQIGSKAKYQKEVFEVSRDSNIPEQCKFLGAKNAYILGYGKEGKITKQYLKKQYPKLKVGIGDGARDKKYLEKQSDFDIAVKTPGIKKELVTIPYTTATNIFFSLIRGRASDNLTIGITGSKGKSTTSSLIYHILKTAGKDVELLGNIGTPMLQALLKPIPNGRIFVLELSSYQLDDIQFSPDIAVVTNLFPEHMDFHGSLKAYYEAKKNIINFQTPENFFVYNQKSAGWLKNYRGKVVAFSSKKYASNLIGQHNQSNIGAAVAVAEILKIPKEIIKKAVKSFKGLEHRLEFAGEFKEIKFYDDAISTTPESTIMAIKALKNVNTIFLGGQDRGYDFKELEKVIKKSSIRNIVLFPDSGHKIIKQTNSFNILKTNKMEKAVQFAYKNTKRGSVCLLSCASPSYSLWKNFEVKGDEFKRYVKKYRNIEI